MGVGRHVGVAKGVVRACQGAAGGSKKANVARLRSDCDGSVIAATGQIPPRATWIDLEEPTRDEEQKVERSLGFAVPTRDTGSR